ncbi:expressed unknown protein [Seminavis robusta]|uniref:Uncharacterized protein n=1 Tax=Seminavis robusta TaxID=568900 RepID=A0A9N8DZU1_9STRA|nr:expressed unknown protein [Seminavis robusta]|eukprot:Sro509_g157110.1 n/a (196) ;mRNA; r:47898-48485
MPTTEEKTPSSQDDEGRLKDLAASVESAIDNPTYVLTKDIEQHNPETVWKALSTPGLLMEMHPLIVDVQVIQRQEGDDGTIKGILDVTDQLEFLCGLVKSKTTYRAYMHCSPPKANAEPASGTRKIYFQTSTMGTTVSTRIDCEPANATGTTVTQTTFITAPFGLRRYVQQTARMAHEGSLESLPSILDKLSSGS